jgi:hypothetical protein
MAVTNAVVRGTRPSAPDDCPPEIAEVMNRCWHEDQHARPSFDDVLPLLEKAQERLRNEVRSRRRSSRHSGKDAVDAGKAVKMAKGDAAAMNPEG